MNEQHARQYELPSLQDAIIEHDPSKFKVKGNNKVMSESPYRRNRNLNSKDSTLTNKQTKRMKETFQHIAKVNPNAFEKSLIVYGNDKQAKETKNEAAADG